MKYVILFLSSQAFALLNPPQFVSLVPPDAYQLLEAENQIQTLCPEKTTKNIEQCKAEKLKSKTWTLTVYEAPKKESKSLGHILITATPGKMITAEYINSVKKSVPLPPDSDGTDWGYSSFFEFTIQDRRGDWMKLPKRPFAKPVWINQKLEWHATNQPIKMNTETIYKVKDHGNVVITKYSGNQITFRKENPNDMSCGADPVVVDPIDLKTTTKPVNILYDSDEHLTAWMLYPGGC